MHQLQAKLKFVYGNSIFFEILPVKKSDFCTFNLSKLYKSINGQRCISASEGRRGFVHSLKAAELVHLY